MTQPPERVELDALSAGLALVRHELAELKRGQAISEEEIYKRLVWYSHLERLVVVVNEYLAGRAGQDELRDMAERVRLVHRFVSPAVNTPEQEQDRAEAANVEPFRRPA